MKQIVAHKKLGTVQGILLVLALAAALILINYLVIDVLAACVSYKVAGAAFWVCGGLIAWQVLRIYIVKYTYALNGGVLRLSRSYGKRERPIEEIYLNCLLFVGAPEAAKKRWPGLKRVRALHARGECPVTAVVYDTAGGRRMALIQANDELKARLTAQVKGK